METADGDDGRSPMIRADAISRWAAAHAATLPAAAGALATAPPPRPRPAAEPAPVRLAAFREVHSWDADMGPAYSVAWGSQPDGRLLLATGDQRGAVTIWDPGTGESLRTLAGHAEMVQSVAWGHLPGGRSLLATGSNDNTARIWDPETGESLHTLTGHTSTAVSVAWGYQPDGEPLLATGSYDNTARIWDPDTGQLLRTLTGHTDAVYTVAFGYRPDGGPLLVTSGSVGDLRIWDPGTGQLLHTLTGHTGAIFSAAWRDRPGGQAQLATASADGSVRLWDGAEPTSQVLIEQERMTAVACITLSDGRAILAARSYTALYLWDGMSLELLHTETGRFSVVNAANLAWALAPDGRLLLASPADDERVHIWEAVLDPPAEPPREPRHAEVRARGTASGPAQDAALRLAESARWLQRLGQAGLWVPLGLIADLVELTGPEGADGGGRLGPLADEPGIGRLRALGWQPEARVAFAALLASRLDIPERYAPPPDASPAALRDALARALARALERGRRPPAAGLSVPAGAVRTAAAQVTDQAVTLLRILGPAACAADPLLPVRLAHRVPQLPALSPRELRMLTTGGTRRSAGERDSGMGMLAYSPGIAGLARSGPLARLLPSQLALPRDLMTMRLAENQLLYRQHRAPAPPAPEPVTIILDTTPPTYGPAGITLRLAAHLITGTLWEHGRQPCLITLTDPGTVRELRESADLVCLWTSISLDPPAPALAAALAAAAATGQAVVFCTHHHTARDLYLPGPRTRLLTAHHPPEEPPALAGGDWHAHLSPGATAGQFAEAITRLLSPGSR